MTKVVRIIWMLNNLKHNIDTHVWKSLINSKKYKYNLIFIV